ncbi:MAG: hypothetical protein PHR42_04095, partial [Caldisericia bacterium]|nr:hypothetical protein [Caldisericia bacterium]
GRIRTRVQRTTRLLKGVVYASLGLTLQRGLLAPYILARRPNLDVVGGLSTNRPNLRGCTMPEKELTAKQIGQQDFIDNNIYGLLVGVSEKEIEWDMELISIVREVVQEIICDRLKLMTEMEFYPYIEDEEAIMVDVSEVDWELLRKQKLHLLEILSDENSSVTAEHHASIEGIVSFLDSIQDGVVDTGKLSAEKVFGELESQEESDADNAHELGF